MVKFIEKELVDEYGRRVRKLRISLTDKCNMRCHYCMPVDSSFMEENKYLSPDEIFIISQELCHFGLEEIRLTGGEPLIRKSIREIIEKLGQLPLKKFGITTNAVFLAPHLEHLSRNRVHFLNISLDSLQPERFHKITHSPQLARVLKNIELAREMGMSIKINMVVMNGVNEDEIFDFIELSKKWGIEIRFLELMKIGFACGTQERQFISAQTILSRIQEKYQIRKQAMALDSTSFNYVSECGAQFGFIASESQAFCGSCSRWRLSADGMLRACLFKEEGLSIKDKSKLEREEIYFKVLGMKPKVRSQAVFHQMNTIGG
jgi:cyclic pyranopterin phosphate synthase